jgi:hypothetical protein
MLEEIFGSTTEEAVTFGVAVLNIAVALACGLAISLVYMKTMKNSNYSQNFIITLVMLSAVVALVIMMVGNSAARALSMAGAFTLIRFRSAPGDPKDILYIFLSMAMGMTSGLGYIAYAGSITILMCLVLIILSKTGFGQRKAHIKSLRITIPEDMDYAGVFEEVFARYTKSHTFEKVKTTDLGSLFELTYTVVMNEGANEKAMIDELRCRNFNLTIVLSAKADNMSMSV